MEKEIINNNYEIVRVEKYSGEYTNEEGQTYPYKFFKVFFKEENSPLVMSAKVDKVFNDYVEGDYEN